MNKRVGGEAIMGLGGGKVSAESTRNLEIAEDLCRKGRPYEAVPYLHKALEDARNLDAPIQLAFLAPNFQESIRILERAKKLGEVFLRVDLGEKCLDDDGDRVGHYWSLIETRPYMRILQALVRFYVEDGRFDQAANTSIEMLRLNPGDNQGQRTWTGPLLLKANRPADALSFLQHWLDPAVRREGRILPRGGCDFEAPSKEPLSAGARESLGKYVEGTFVYTAALAAFKLWGPCELAEQYLTIATELNPAVLLKVLGKIARPKTLNMSARQLNSSESAHDFLWLCQDLWMEQDVWEWANSNQKAVNYLLKPCSKKGCPNKETRVAQFKRCGACHGVWYCGQACQKSDWPAHKPKCQQHLSMKAAVKAMSRGGPLPTDSKIFGASADFFGKGIATQWHG